MKVTMETLRDYQNMMREIIAIEAQIDAMYYPVASPRLSGDGGRNSTPGDPTAIAVARITGEKEKLEKKKLEYLRTTEEIKLWVDGLTDGYIAAIVRLHFLSGYTWAETCKKIYGYANKDTCRQALKRYFKRQKEETENENTR